MTIAPPHKSQSSPAAPPWLWVALLIAALTAMRLVYAGVLDLRTDEAYYGPGRRRARFPFSIIRPASPG